MKVLGIETATVTCSAAVVVDGAVVAESMINRPRAHAEMLLSQVDEVLAKAALTTGEMDGVAVSIGPGSFTGLRIGLSVAKGLAWSAAKPLAGVSTLKALARKAFDAGEPGEGRMLLSVLDARKGEVYCRMDRVLDDLPEPVWEERCLRVDELLRKLRDMQVVVTGESGQFKDGVERWEGVRIIGGDVNRCSAGPVALEGEVMLMGGEVTDIRVLEPKYIKEFEPRMKAT